MSEINLSQELPFEPFPFLSDPHRQTILGAYLNFTKEPQSTQKLVPLPDGDKISLEITTPSGWKETDLTVLLVHGICSSHEAPTLVRMATRLEALGIRAIRFNMRGCGSGIDHASKLYHCGASEDVFDSLKAIKKETPASPIILVGYSMGANISLKLTGELGKAVHSFLKGVIAVSPPVDINTSIEMISRPENKIYYDYFVRTTLSKVTALRKRRKDLPPLRLPKNITFAQFDEIYTAPLHGFQNASDYYAKCSSLHYISEIEIPCHILFAKDDPLVPHHLLDGEKLPSHVQIFKTQYGGHLGFIGNAEGHEGIFWLDSIVTQWIGEMQNAKRKMQK